MPKTTAQLRSEANSAENRQEYGAAAGLYAQAIAVYPKHHAGSAHAKADLAHLSQREMQCRATTAAGMVA